MKYVAPIIIVVLILSFILLQLTGILSIPYLFLNSPILFIVIIITAVSLGAALVVVLIKRIKEIKEDEKDDLGKY